MEHTCHATGCKVKVAPRMLMCYSHWRLVPQKMKAAVWEHYEPGQELSKNPSPEYLIAATNAINAVAAKEVKKASLNH